MSHNAEERGRSNGTTATNEQFNQPTNTGDGGSMASSAVEETSSESPVDMSVEAAAEDYSMCPTHKSVGGSLPDTNTNTHYSSKTVVENGEKQKNKEQPPLLEPPVTKATLSELDVNKIVHNPKLRHDINFDPELHFRPNLDGEKGRRKTQRADRFWETMRIQLGEYLLDREQFEKELGEAEWCLPATLKAIRGILETLVPQRDRASVEETFNTDLLMQQFRKGVADLPKLAAWLSRLLKCHCAPMRDTWVDGMVSEISKGDQEGDVALLTLGMRNLLGVLEAMKLDVANHQIRCLRPLLIEDTVHFEHKFFMKKIAMKRVDVAGAHLWFKEASSIPEVGPGTESQGNFWDFMKALVNLILPSKSGEVPHTFLFDEERLIKLRSDIEDLINYEICMYNFYSLDANIRIQERRFTTHDDTPVTSAIPSPSSRPASPADNTLQSTQTRLPQPHHFAPKSKLSAVRHEQFKPAHSGHSNWEAVVENEATDLANSPRSQSSPASTASTPETYPPTPLYLSLPVIDSASRLRSSLQAILDSSNASNRWIALGPSLALQIVRSTATPLTILPHFESLLMSELSNPQHKAYQDAEQRVLSRLLPALQKLVETYTPLSSLQIFETATAPKSSAGDNSIKEEMLEIATRIAHIGTLHWRVWAPLAYLVDPDEQQAEVTRPRSMP